MTFAPIEGELRKIYETDRATFTDARIELELKYGSILQPTQRFNRRLVSFQANKNVKMHRWFKYKEAFSAQLVHKLIESFGLKPPSHILDPFAGVSTALLAARECGLDATGIEVLPICDIVWLAKSQTGSHVVSELKSVRQWVESTPTGQSQRRFSHIPITLHAFDTDTEAELMWYDEQFVNLVTCKSLKSLLKFVLLSILEDISYTSKDGQFLRWDIRSDKVRKRNQKRVAAGKRPYKEFRKASILDVKTAILKALDLIISDVALTDVDSVHSGKQQLIQGTVLDALPRQDTGQFDAVITSPPYCNRYDYTRTYALELAFLGLTNKEVIALRQDMISCTVENRSKLKRLQALYESLGRLSAFDYVYDVLAQNRAFQEILDALRIRSRRREVNNTGVISMVEGYFTELAFVTLELFRVCKPGAYVGIVNDNVRYSGEVIPVDLLMTDIAASLGFEPESIHVLQQRKGNSSQQMGKYGREALRKSILIWKKPGIRDAD
ncbi:MAG: modification methylase [Chloroflexota bacterium]|nr:modification methylase [Chloroflexota bacterium]MDE2909536.1 modification methylase [Chloroflexota bacterium]